MNIEVNISYPEDTPRELKHRIMEFCADIERAGGTATLVTSATIPEGQQLHFLWLDKVHQGDGKTHAKA